MAAIPQSSATDQTVEAVELHHLLVISLCGHRGEPDVETLDQRKKEGTLYEISREDLETSSHRQHTRGEATSNNRIPDILLATNGSKDAIARRVQQTPNGEVAYVT